MGTFKGVVSFSFALGAIVFFGCGGSSRDGLTDEQRRGLVEMRNGLDEAGCVSRCLDRSAELDSINWMSAQVISESCLAERDPFGDETAAWRECSDKRRVRYLQGSRVPGCLGLCLVQSVKVPEDGLPVRTFSSPCNECRFHAVRLEEENFNCRVKCGKLEMQVVQSCDRLAVWDLEMCRRGLPNHADPEFSWQICLEMRGLSFSYCTSARMEGSEGYCERNCPLQKPDCSTYCDSPQ